MVIKAATAPVEHKEVPVNGQNGGLKDYGQQLFKNDMGVMAMGFNDALAKSWEMEKARKANSPLDVDLHDDSQIRYGYDIIKGIQPKNSVVRPSILRAMAMKAAAVKLIHVTRNNELCQYARESRNESDKGFQIRHKKKRKAISEQERGVTDEIVEWIQNLGDLTKEERYDAGWEHMSELKLPGYMSSTIDDLLTLDGVSTYFSNDRGGDLRGFFPVDAATIYRVQKPYRTNMLGKNKVVYAQVIGNKIKHAYMDSEMQYAFMNKRTDSRFTGYGYSPLEMSMDVVIAWIFGFQYNTGIFSKHHAPRGFLSVSGSNVNQDTISTIERYWRAAMSGLNGTWAIPILPATEDGTVEWQNIRPSNQEMEFQAWMDLTMSTLFALHGMSAEEAGIRLQSSSKVFFEDTEQRVSSSMSIGLSNILHWYEDHFTNIINRIEKWKDWEFVFTGKSSADKQQENEAAKGELTTFKSMNQLLKEKDLPEFKGALINVGGKQFDIGDIPAPLDPTWGTLLSLANQSEQQEAELEATQAQTAVAKQGNNGNGNGNGNGKAAPKKK